MNDKGIVQKTSDGVINYERQIPSDAELLEFVIPEIKQCVTNAESFTGYGIALKLREKFPNYEFRRGEWIDRRTGVYRNKGVSATVHEIMDKASTLWPNNPYTREWRIQVDGEEATEYIPMIISVNPLPDIKVDSLPSDTVTQDVTPQNTNPQLPSGQVVMHPDFTHVPTQFGLPPIQDIRDLNLTVD